MNIPGYTIELELGCGGMSTVYLAVQESLDRHVALKVMPPALAHDQSFKDRFLREGRTVAKLNHPYIVTIYDIGLTDDYCFISMEYVSDGDLSTRIREGLTVEQCLQIVRRVASALSYAHLQGFVHRDLKPSNILFRENEYAVLADFGIAKSINEDQTLTQAGLTPGTPTYMSPEQARGHPLDGRSDLYSLGVVFYEMLTGKRLFVADTGIATILKHLTEPPPDLPDEFGNLQPIIGKLLAKAPADRFDDASEFLKALDSIDAAALTIPSKDPDRTVLEPVATVLESQATVLEKVQVLNRNRWRSIADNLQAKTQRFREKPQRWRLALGTAAVTIGAVFLLIAQPWHDSDEDPVLADNALSTQSDQSERQALREDTPVQVEDGSGDNVERRVTELLDKADRQLSNSVYLTPERDNALITLQQALELDPDNARAKSGLQTIAGHFLREAQSAWNAARPEAAQAAIAKGLRASPQNSDLLALKNAIQTQTASEPDNSQRVEKLLASADSHFSGGRLVKPEGNNAYETYQQVLEIDPDNRTAQKRLLRIANQVYDEAQEVYKSGNLKGSLALVNSGLKADPNHVRLSDLRANIDRALETQQRVGRIESLLEEAGRHVASSRLTLPAGGNAQETYQTILELEPGNQQALSGLEQIADRYRDLARARQQTGDLKGALQLAQRGLTVRPQHTALRSLRSQVQAALKGQNENQGEIDRLLTLARSQVETLKLTHPPGDNAHETVQKILQGDPENSDAKKILKQLSTRYESLVRARQLEGSLEGGLALAKEGLKVDPNHAGLLKLKEELSKQLTQRRESEPAPKQQQQRTRSFGTF